MGRTTSLDWNDPTTGFCKNCGKRVDIIVEDQGYGETEYWGSVSTHHAWVYVCSECGEEIEDIY